MSPPSTASRTGRDRRPRRRPPPARPCPGCGEDLRRFRAEVAPSLGVLMRRCPRCGLGVAVSHGRRWPGIRHLAGTAAAIVRLIGVTLVLVGLAAGGAGLAHTVSLGASQPTSARVVAIVIVVIGGGVFIGSVATVALRHRGPRSVGVVMAVGILTATAYGEAWTAATPSAGLLAMAAASVIGGVATLITFPTAALARFLGRFDHLLPWTAR